MAAHLLGVEACVQASADARELAAGVCPLAINVNDLNRRERAGEAVSLASWRPARTWAVEVAPVRKG